MESPFTETGTLLCSFFILLMSFHSSERIQRKQKRESVYFLCTIYALD